MGRANGLGRPARRRGLPRCHGPPPGARPAMAARFAGGWPFGRIIGLGVLIVALFSLLAIGVGRYRAGRPRRPPADRVVNTLDPAAFHASQLEVELLNQETGVRGYALSAQQAFLAPYYEGLAGQARQVATLRQLLAGMPAATGRTRAGAAAGGDLAGTVRRADDQSGAEPPGNPGHGATVGQGKADFDSMRAALAALQGDLAAQRAHAVGSLNHARRGAGCDPHRPRGRAAGRRCSCSRSACGGRRSCRCPGSPRTPGRWPRVTSSTSVEPGGPPEMRAVGLDVNRMRERILAELSAVQAAQREPGGQDRGPAAVELRAGAVRLRGLARPAGAAAEGGQLLPAAAAPLRGPAGREGRRVHRARRGRRQADAGADQRPARVQPGGADRAAP